MLLEETVTVLERDMPSNWIIRVFLIEVRYLIIYSLPGFTEPRSKPLDVSSSLDVELPFNVVLPD